MRVASRFAIVIAWASLLLVVTASMDKVPDDPAVLKHFSARAVVDFDHHARGPVVHAAVLPVGLAPVDGASRADSFVALEEIPHGDTGPRCLRLASDSSPPSRAS